MKKLFLRHQLFTLYTKTNFIRATVIKKIYSPATFQTSRSSFLKNLFSQGGGPPAAAAAGGGDVGDC